MGESTIGINYRVVTGVDLSETGDHALREAMRLCRTLLGSELHVVYVIGVEHDLHNAGRIDELASLLRARMDQLREHVSDLLLPEHGTGYSHQIVFHVRVGDGAVHVSLILIEVNLVIIALRTRLVVPIADGVFAAVQSSVDLLRVLMG